MLHEFITTHRADIIARCEDKARVRRVAVDPKVPRVSCVPLFLDQLVEKLRRITPVGELGIMESALQHGHHLLTQGFTVSQVVYEYGDICQAITELAVDASAPVRTDDFRCLNQCLDDAIAAAVSAYGRARDHVINRHADLEDQRLLALTTKLQMAIQMAKLARDMVQTGHVSLLGSTSSLLDMSLNAANALAKDLLDEFSTAGINRSVARFDKPRPALLPVAFPADVAVALPAHDRRERRLFDRRQVSRGGRRAADQLPAACAAPPC